MKKSSASKVLQTFNVAGNYKATLKRGRPTGFEDRHLNDIEGNIIKK